VLNDLNELERTLFAIMFLNFTLVHEGIPCIHMVTKDYERYFKYRRLYLEGKTEKIIEFIRLIILNGKYQSKDFYKKLKPLTLADIKKGIIEEKGVLVNDYKIKSMIIFGSFAKNDYRLDSDIDLLIMFEDGISLKERVQKVEDVKTLLFNKFNRYIDIHEIFKDLPDFILKETTEIITIYKEEEKYGK
jgi:predicted nucleotidyltransferase